VDLISRTINVDAENILDWDLYFHDTQPA